MNVTIPAIPPSKAPGGPATTPPTHVPATAYATWWNIPTITQTDIFTYYNNTGWMCNYYIIYYTSI